MIFALSKSNKGNTKSIITFSPLLKRDSTAYSKPIFKKISVIDFSTWIMFYGWLFLFVSTLLQSPEYLRLQFFLNLQLKVLVSILYLAIFIVYATIIFAYGVKRFGPTRTAIFINLIPVFGILSSIIILSEAFSFWYIPAFVSIMIGVYKVNKSNKL